MTELADCSATELRALLARRACSVVDIVTACLARITALEPVVRAFVEIDAPGALAQAHALDALAAPPGPLFGIPVAVKDTVDVAGLHCIWGTAIHADRVPATDAACVRRLRAAGAVIIGTTVTTEYAMAQAGPTTNPHNAAHTPGGSSSGSGASVAARMAPLAVATQSVGSIIRPASFCGVYGLKPTRGAISTQGVMPLSAEFDHAGPMARNVADVALAASAMYGLEPGDPTGIAVPPPQLGPLPPGTKVLRIDGPLQDRIEPPTAMALDRAQQAFTAAGFAVEAVTLPARFAHLIACYEAVVFHGMAKNHGADRDRFPDRMSARLREIIDTGRSVTPAAYQAALADAAYYREYLSSLLADGAIILTPATDGSAPLMSDKTGEQKLQALWTVTGLPSLGTPVGKYDGLPVGVQIVASLGQDHLTLAGGGVIEAAWGHENTL